MNIFYHPSTSGISTTDVLIQSTKMAGAEQG
ncbi:MAG: hypothetical protein JWR40_1507 [Massilia sp.]|nr:hypothetical protein [Massilia sp.]MDB5953068.1 hypothetical protein [Massilia sp.]